MNINDTLNGEDTLSSLANTVCTVVATQNGSQTTGLQSGSLVTHRSKYWIATGANPPMLQSVASLKVNVWLDTNPASPTYKKFYTRKGNTNVWQTLHGTYENLIEFLEGGPAYRITPATETSPDFSYDDTTGHGHEQPIVSATYPAQQLQPTHYPTNCHNHHQANNWVRKCGKFVTFYNPNGKAICVSAKDFLSEYPRGLFIEQDGGMSLNIAEALQSDGGTALAQAINLILSNPNNSTMETVIGAMVDGVTIGYENGQLVAIAQPVPLATANTVGGFKIKPNGEFSVDALGNLVLNYDSIKGVTTGVLLATGTDAQTILVGQTQDVNGCAIALDLSAKSDIRITANAHPISVSASDPAYGVLRAVINNTPVKSAHGSSYSFQFDGKASVNQVPNATHLDTVITNVQPGRHLIKLTWTTLGPECCAGGIILNQNLYTSQSDMAAATENGLLPIDSQALKCDLILDIKSALR